MEMIRELGMALRVTAQVLGQGQYWAQLGKGLLTVPMLLTGAVLGGASVALMHTPVAMLFSAGAGLGPLALLFVASIILGPLLIRAWCPVAARAAAGALRLDLPEAGLPSFALLFGRCLWVGLVLLLLSIGAIFLPHPWKWLLWLPAVIAVSGFQVRNALCAHASGAEIDAVAADTLWRRSLLWVVLCSLPGLLADGARSWAMRQGSMEMLAANAGVLFTGIEIVAGLLLVAIALPSWAALALQALAARRGLGGPGMVTLRAPRPPRPRRARERRTVSNAQVRGFLLVLLLAAGLGYTQRFSVLHYYLMLRDYGNYADSFSDRSTELGHEQRVALALRHFACKGDITRVELLLLYRVKPVDGNFDRELICAAGSGNIPTIELLLQEGADINASPGAIDSADYQPRTALQMAADRAENYISSLLLRHGADPSLHNKGPIEKGTLAPLHIAARHYNLALINILVKAGAKADDPYPAPPVQFFADNIVRHWGKSKVDWDRQLDLAAGAGLVLTATGPDGAGLLHWAAGQGRFDLIDALLRRGFDRRQTDQRGIAPFMMLLGWYHAASREEPGPELEAALTTLAEGIDNFNGRLDVPIETSPAVTEIQPQLSVAEVAARRPRIRALFGRRIDDSALRAAGWSDLAGQAESQR